LACWPTNGSAGTSVNITGNQFTAASAVVLNGTVAAFTVLSDSLITTIVPTNAGSGFISVTTPSGTAISTNTFTVLKKGGTVVSGSPYRVRQFKYRDGEIIVKRKRHHRTKPVVRVIVFPVLAEFPGDFALAGLSEGEGFKGAVRMETERGGGWARHHLLAGGWANRFAPDLAPLRCAGPVFDHCAAGRAESTSKA
jgi:hypothetical protein